MRINKNRLETLLIKPFLGCDSNCPTCNKRQEIYGKIKTEPALALADWHRILEEGRDLGAKNLIISGGEPMLYGHLVELIAYAKKLGYLIRLNTSGGKISEKKAEELLEAGLSGVMISLLSSEAKTHDKMKNNEGLWQRACAAVIIFKKLKNRFPDFSLTTQFYIAKNNYQEIDRLVKLHYDLGSDMVRIGYLEWAFQMSDRLLDNNEIEKIRKGMIPKLKIFSRSVAGNFHVYNLIGIENVFSRKINDSDNYSRGKYNKKMPCSLPESSMILLANGDVLACCAADYAREPIIGNLFKDSLKTIAGSTERKKFIKNRYRKYQINYCDFCPIPLIFCLNFRPCAENKRIIRNRTGFYFYSLISRLSPRLGIFLRENCSFLTGLLR